MKKNPIVFGILLGILLLGAGISAPFVIKNYNLQIKERSIEIKNPQSQTRYTWENFSVSWEIVAQNTPIQYFFILEDHSNKLKPPIHSIASTKITVNHKSIDSADSNKNNSDPLIINFNAPELPPSNYLLSINITDNTGYTKIASIELKILLDNDTDLDGLYDQQEIAVYQTDPDDNDSDDDTIDDFSEIKLFKSDPNVPTTNNFMWDGGLVEILPDFREFENHFIPGYPLDDLGRTKIPRLLYKYLIDQIGLNECYIQSFQRISPIKILVIDNFNSPNIEEQYHGNICKGIAQETFDALDKTYSDLNSINIDLTYQILNYSIYESSQNLGTALQFAINHGIDVISISLVWAFGSYPFFSEINEVVSKYGIVFCAGTGNDNRGDGNDFQPNQIRYPASHPATFAIGGIVETNGNWRRWVDGSGGSNWGLNALEVEGKYYNTTIDLVENCHRTILFQNYYGVSWAVPRIAGLVGMIIKINPILLPNQIKQIIQIGSTKISPNYYIYKNSPFPIQGYENHPWTAEVAYGIPNFSEIIDLL